MDTSKTNFPGLVDWYIPTPHPMGGPNSDTIHAIKGNLGYYKPIHQAANYMCTQQYWPFNLPNNRAKKTFVQCKLKSALQAGCIYNFSAFVLPIGLWNSEPNPQDSNSWASKFVSTKNLGFYFSTTAIFDSVNPYGQSFDTYNIQPQVTLPQNQFITDTSQYTRISGQFIAQGGEEFLTIGFFDPMANTPCKVIRDNRLTIMNDSTMGLTHSVFHIDSLNLYRKPPSPTLLTSTDDTSMCANDTLPLQAKAIGSDSLRWDNGDTARIRAITQPGTYYVDAFYPCGDILSDTIVVTLKDTLITSRHDTNICPGDSLMLTPNTFGAINYIWDDNTTDSIRKVNSPGTYWVNSYHYCGRTISDTIVVSAKDVLPPITLNDTAICEGEAAHYKVPPGPVYTLNNNPVGTNFDISTAGQYSLIATNTCESDTFTFEVSYLQVPSIPNIVIPDTALCEGGEMQITLPDSLSYELNSIPVKQNPITISKRNDYELLADNGCETRLFRFTVNDEGCETLIFVPNAFTPDGDGVNDCFEVSVIEQLSYHIMIFNRWGQMVYESYNPDECWDGTYKGTSKADVYTYLIVVGASGREIKKRGMVQVLK